VLGGRFDLAFEDGDGPPVQGGGVVDSPLTSANHAEVVERDGHLRMVGPQDRLLHLKGGAVVCRGLLQVGPGEGDRSQIASCNVASAAA
jgi:hypothetical protein